MRARVYLYLPRDRKLVPTGPGDWDGTLTKADVELAERYRLWCQSAYPFYGDCLGGALVAGRYLDMQGRYVWALAMSKSPVLDELKKALGEPGAAERGSSGAGEATRHPRNPTEPTRHPIETRLSEAMSERFFRLADDVNVPHRWHLDTPKDRHDQ